MNKKIRTALIVGGGVGVVIIFVIILSAVFDNHSDTLVAIGNTPNTYRQSAAITQSDHPTPSGTKNNPVIGVQLPPVQNTNSQPVSASAPVPTTPTFSLKAAEIADANSFSSDFITQGVIWNLIPPMSVQPHYTIYIKDPTDSSYKAFLQTDDQTVYDSLAIGDIIQFQGSLRGNMGDTNIGRFMQVDSSIQVVSVGDAQTPSPSSVLSQTQTVVQQYQPEISTALANVNYSTSFNECMTISNTIQSQICQAADLPSSCVVPYSYKESMDVLNTATASLLQACWSKWYPNTN